MTGYAPQKHNRRSIRLAGWDYARAGAYFVSVVTQKRKPILGRVVDGQMLLLEYGVVAQQAWEDLPNHYPHVQLDARVIMPNVDISLPTPGVGPRTVRIQTAA